MEPKVSIILPTYNRAFTIKRAISSITNQTYRDFELIVIDDGSSDNTQALVASFSDSRIKYIRLLKNSGAQVARNAGLKAAKGVFIAFQDSDNEWSREKLKIQVETLEGLPDEVGLVYCNEWRIDQQGGKTVDIPLKINPEDGIVYKRFLSLEVYIDLMTALVRRECFDRLGLMDENMPRLQDLELFTRLSKYYRFYHIDQPLATWYSMSDSISSDNHKLIKAYKYLIVKNYSDIIAHDILFIYHKVLAQAFYQQSCYQESRYYYSKYLKKKRGDVKSITRYVLTFLKSRHKQTIEPKRNNEEGET